MANEINAEMATENAENPILNAILKMASNDVDIQRLEIFIRLYSEQRQELARENFNKRLANAQADIAVALKNAKNPMTRSLYADYTSISRAVEPAIKDHGFSVTYREDQPINPDHVKLTCIVALDSYEREYSIEVPFDMSGLKGNSNKTMLQAHGSAITYARRYLKTMIFDVATSQDDDNDGNPIVEPTEFINTDQINELNEMLVERGINIEIFLKYFKINALSQIPANQFKNVVDRILMRDKKIKGDGNE